MTYLCQFYKLDFLIYPEVTKLRKNCLSDLFMFFYLDLGIRVTALEEGLSEHSVAITDLQETDIGFEQRIGDLEDKILRNYFDSKCVMYTLRKFYF